MFVSAVKAFTEALERTKDVVDVQKRISTVYQWILAGEKKREICRLSEILWLEHNRKDIVRELREGYVPLPSSIWETMLGTSISEVYTNPKYAQVRQGIKDREVQRQAEEIRRTTVREMPMAEIKFFRGVKL